MSKNLDEALKLAEEIVAHKRERFMDSYRPYAKQREFHKMGAVKLERLLMAGNQLGKTYGGTMEDGYHLTGEYPDWWEGRRWNRPIKAWLACETSLLTRDVLQKYMIGEPGVQEAIGTGVIPKASILDISMARGVTDAIDTVQVKHKSGGVSILRFKSFDQKREAWQGETIDLLHCDEEPPDDRYQEGKTRTQKNRGLVMVTFTPLKGRSTVVKRFTDEPSPERGMVVMTIEDAEHYTPERRAEIIAGYAPHERDARARGIPMQGQGRIFTVAEDVIGFDMPQSIPGHWARGCGIDFGYDHPFAAVWGAWDRESDTIYIYDAYCIKGTVPALHAVAVKARARVPIFWPHDGHNTEKGSGEPLKLIYKKHGLHMWDTHAQHEDGSNSVEAGISEMTERFMTGRLRVAKHLLDWWTEYRLYHREDGKIVKVEDDLLDATRYLVMMKRHMGIAGKYVTVDGNRPRRNGNGGTDFWDFVRG